MHHQKNLIYLIRGLGFQKIMRNYLYKGNSARIYRLFKFYRTAIKMNNFFNMLDADMKLMLEAAAESPPEATENE